MPNIPHVSNPIEDALETTPIKQELRPYLGYSLLGHVCPRYIWYSFRWGFSFNISPRVQRLFNRGHQEEKVVVPELRSIGIECYDVLEEQAEVVGGMGHMKGHPDGRCFNVPGAIETPHSLEIKTASDKKFKEFKKFGVERANPRYWVQTQCYMNKQDLTRCLYIITNKNDDHRLYLRIHADPRVAEEAEEKGFDIISTRVPPRKISERPEWYECKFCEARNVCHLDEPAERNCRTCEWSTVLDKGEWGCRVYTGKSIPVDFQRTGCADHYKPLF